MAKKASMGLEVSNQISSLGKVIWVTDFDDNALKHFYAEFSAMEDNPSVQVIPIAISSYGGEVDVFIAMRDLIKTSTKPVATICLGKAMSCGAFLLAAGTAGYRFSSMDSTIMVHEVSSAAYGKTLELKNSAASVERLNTLVMNRFAEDTGQRVSSILSKLQKRQNTDWFMGSKEALENGIVDHVSIPRIIIDNPHFSLAVPTVNFQKKKERALKQAMKKAKQTTGRAKHLNNKRKTNKA